jgi:hypothetical protein
MTERGDPHATEGIVGPHGSPTDHGGDHGHDDHGHAAESGEALGPLDARAWGAAALGIALGLAVVAVLLVAIGFGSGGS